MKKRRVAIAVRQWNSEEGTRTWKFCKQHVLQPKDGPSWNDQLTLVHVTTKGPRADGKTPRPEKEREREAWDSGGPTIPDVATAVQPYNCAIQELETQGDASLALVDYVNKEGMDILVLASRGRGAVKKAMMGSITEQVMSRAACACLVVKPQVGAGDTYRMKSAASSAAGGGAGGGGGGAPAPPKSPVASPIYAGRGSQGPGGLATPFNRRVAIAYDTTASGRYLLKWAAENILEPADNIFVVRAVPRTRRPGTSFADKNSVQRLAGDALSGLPHITTFNLPQQGNARKAVLDFAGKESVDMLVIGMYKGSCKRKGLARRGNATTIYNRAVCPVMVVPMSEAALVVAVKAAELEAAAQEEAELASGSESDSDEEPEEPEGEAGAASWMQKNIRLKAIGGVIADALNPARRRSGIADGAAAAAAGTSPTASGDGARGARAGAAALALAGGGLGPGRYVLEIDAAGGIKSINPVVAGDAAAAAAATASDGSPDGRVRRSSTGSVDAAAGGDAALRLLRQQKEIEELKAQLERLMKGGGGGGAAAGAEAAEGAPAAPEAAAAAPAAAGEEADGGGGASA